MEFRKYLHIEQFGNDEVQGIELGKCYVFPKLDGTNASIWLNDNGELCAGSRKRQLSLEEDNASFLAFASQDPFIIKFLKTYPRLRLYGEWLCPHSLKTYEDTAWRKFYVFDVYHDQRDTYISYEKYKPMLDKFNIGYIPAICSMKNGTYENLLVELQNNKFLIKEGEGVGEGIVIKNYEYENKFGRICFAKMITNVFKEKHSRVMGPTDKLFKEMMEQQIVDTYVDVHFVNKVYAKIVNDIGGWNSKCIPQLLSTVYYDLVNEELWNIIKKLKNPTINFKTLHCIVIIKIKSIMPELF